MLMPLCISGPAALLDPDALSTPYVQHKLAMEQMVRTHRQYLILRLPQVAGKTPNPHTLLNYLYARVSRSESFNLWNKAKRNIIDVADVASIAQQFIVNNSVRNITLNIANVVNYPIIDIVSAMERVVGKHAVYDIVERGSEYPIDTRAVLPELEKAGVKFGNGYLEKVIEKYYKSCGCSAMPKRITVWPNRRAMLCSNAEKPLRKNIRTSCYA